ncbi:hypothetical protein DACRYDRAFT_14739 [Dacryopinax primogenitus]|uniref:Uncharacterized protein n=1 Tax=Dacryopinax primogenitus (strain DJM 731) TaxID=1858805 RepID=M5G0C9_DACPD|nr:uncharacterized protein DACRYDRAFT_14739 [Dacryopinax primogenitus]EJU03696.1 hypothetical protein DACRYDRAFT_14739 [Dacryopinax primogenitus]
MTKPLELVKRIIPSVEVQSRQHTKIGSPALCAGPVLQTGSVVSPKAEAVIMAGGKDMDSKANLWIHCYEPHTWKNKKMGKTTREMIAMFDKLMKKELQAREAALEVIKAQINNEKNHCTPKGKIGTIKSRSKSAGSILIMLGQIKCESPVKSGKKEPTADIDSNKLNTTKNIKVQIERGNKTNAANNTQTSKRIIRTRSSNIRDYLTKTEEDKKPALTHSRLSSAGTNRSTKRMHSNTNKSGMENKNEESKDNFIWMTTKSPEETKICYSAPHTRSQTSKEGKMGSSSTGIRTGYNKNDPLSIIWKMEDGMILLKGKHPEIKFGTLFDNLEDLAVIHGRKLQDKAK